MINEESRQQLILKFMEGDLSSEEEAEVAQMLHSDSKARAYLREVAEQAVTVADLEKTAQGCQRELNSWADHRPIPRRRWAIIIAATVTLFAILFFSLQVKSEQEVARVVDLNGSLQWTGDRGEVVRDLEIGTSLNTGMIETLSPDAWMSLALYDGSRVTLSGQSAVTIAAPEQNELCLRAGAISANVLSLTLKKPVLIHTPTAMLEVFGAQLNVEATSSSTHLSVNKGTVRVTRLVDGSMVDVPAEHHLMTFMSPSDELKPIRQQPPVNYWKSQLQDNPEGVKGKWLPPSDGVGARLKAVPLLIIKDKKIWAKLQGKVKAGKITPEQAKAKMGAIKKKISNKRVDEDDSKTMAGKLKKAVKKGKLTEEEANVKWAEAMKPVAMHYVLFPVSKGCSPPVLLEKKARFRIRGRIEFAKDAHFGFTTQLSKGGFAGKFKAVKPFNKSVDPKGWVDIELDLHDFLPLQPSLYPSSIGLELKDVWIYTISEQAGLEIMEVELLPPEK